MSKIDRFWDMPECWPLGFLMEGCIEISHVHMTEQSPLESLQVDYMCPFWSSDTTCSTVTDLAILWSVLILCHFHPKMESQRPHHYAKRLKLRLLYLKSSVLTTFQITDQPDGRICKWVLWDGAVRSSEGCTHGLGGFQAFLSVYSTQGHSIASVIFTSI